MSSENENNPLYPIVDEDKYFASRFKAIASGDLEAKVTTSLNAIESSIDAKIMGRKFSDFYDTISSEAKKVLDSDAYNRVMAILKLNPEKAVKVLNESEDFVKLLKASKKLRNSFHGTVLAAALHMEVSPVCKTVVETFTRVGGVVSKIDGWISPALKKNLLGYASKLKEPMSKLGKALPGPWTFIRNRCWHKECTRFFRSDSETKGK